MLSSILKSHYKSQSEARSHQEVLKSAATKASVELTQGYIEHLNEGVAKAYINERRLGNAAKDLASNIRGLTTQAEGWLHLMESFNSTIKDLGDVQNWAQCVERDLVYISTTLESVAKERSSVQSSS